MRELYQALHELMDKEELDKWLDTPCNKFKGATPNEIINRGDTDLIWDMIYRLESGQPG